MKLFNSLGDCQPPNPGPEGANWFKIAYKHEWEAARAVRKNGELINGAWMVGVKWAVSLSFRRFAIKLIHEDVARSKGNMGKPSFFANGVSSGRRTDITNNAGRCSNESDWEASGFGAELECL
jgi:hypothetical protein